MWQGCGSGGVTEVVSVIGWQKLPPCPVEPMLDGSKMDHPLAKAEPVSDGGSAPGITWLRRGESCCTTAVAARERSENV